MTELDQLAEEIGTSGRTLRRAAARGAIRCLRPSERRIVVPPTEHDYVRRHWPLFDRLLQALRTQPNVRLAVLFGSVARGVEDAGQRLAVSLEVDELAVLRTARIPSQVLSGPNAIKCLTHVG